MIDTIKTTTLIFIFCLAANCTITFAQSTNHQNVDTIVANHQVTNQPISYFKFDANYTNNSVYLGRADSLTQPYFSPTLEYYNKRGVYCSASLGFLTSKNSKTLDYISIDAGYEFNINDKLSGSILANKSFYKTESNNISSDIAASIAGNMNYNYGFIELNSGISFSFANKTDIGVYATVSHSFFLGKDQQLWTISPTATANFSTLHFYEGYTSRSFGNRQIFLNPNIQSITSVTKVQQNKLTLMDFEVLTSISYDEKNWGIYFNPTLAIPINPINTTTKSVIKLKNGNSNTFERDSTPASEKNLSNRMYMDIGFYFKF